MSSLRIQSRSFKIKSIMLLKSKGMLKIIHTGDWHLGKILNGKQFLEDQSFILEQFIQCLKMRNLM